MTKVLNTLSTIGALVMAATPLLAIGGFAHAQEMTPTPAHIFVADLNLRSPRDAAVFRQRVSVAANVICRQAGAQSLSVAASCRRAVYDEAVEKLGSAQQSALQTATAGPSGALTVASR